MKPPVFSLELVQLQFDLSNLQFLRIASNILYLIANSHVYRINLEDPSRITEIALTSVIALNGPVTNVFVSPSGCHVVLELTSAHYYLNLHYDRPKLMARFKGVQTTCLRWLTDDPFETDLLVGTKIGQILHTKLVRHDDFAKKDDHHLKCVFKAGSNNAVNDIVIRGHEITVFTHQEIYGWTLDDVVAALKTPPAESMTDASSYQVYQFGKFSDEYLIVKKGKVIKSSRARLEGLTVPAANVLVTRYHLVTFDTKSSTLSITNQLDNKVVYENKLSLDVKESIVGCTADYQSDTATFWLYSTHQIWEIVPNNESKDIWELFVARNEYDEALKSTDSALVRNLIQIRQGRQCLSEGKFKEGANLLANTTEPFESIALNLMDDTETDADTQTEKTDALLDYLLLTFKGANALQKKLLSSWIVELYITKLNQIEGWIISSKRNVGVTDLLASLHGVSTASSASLSKLLAATNQSYERFVRTNQVSLDKETIYQILTNYHNQPQLLFYANIIKDYRFTMTYYIKLKDWENALAVLMAVYCDPPLEKDLEMLSKETSPVELIYEYSTTLLVNSPRATIDVWTKLFNANYPVNVVKLLPALLTFSKTHKSQVIWNENLVILFLQKVIYKMDQMTQTMGSLSTPSRSDVKIIHDVYLSSLITYPSEQKSQAIAKEITKFLKLSKHIDQDFVLRLLIKHDQIQPAIQVLISQSLHSTAIDLALDYNMDDMVEYIINDFDSQLGDGLDLMGVLDDVLWIDNATFIQKKKLWLKVAKYLIKEVVSGSNKLEFVFREFDDEEVSEPSSAAEDSKSKKLNTILRYLLNRSNGLLTLKDILPLFPEFTVINHFQDEIIHSLKSYNNAISQLSQEMKESTKTAERIKQDIEAYKTRFTIIEPGEECHLCELLLVKKQFISFPCGHGFHKDCLLKFYVQNGDYKFQKLFESFRRQRSSPTNSSREEKLKYVTEIDEVLLKSCVLCNEFGIGLLDEGFVDEADKEFSSQWEL
ncbi:hypothetical protein BABINDRAFT_163747 [Babjeviella inositovora NRRL Y-12698]|uniref:RING-type domain-containing protein n=1 Tax=Babjeviella inositovora NRRL Y-12698 TaxID=984486 RepID=A0A1E3QI19_9ASCO|nr:uncharacterized protein BABINDRAFT_163747 [Babjeviella inositovora NRRL Y-12698]ODQ77248.1 hypothetical protein BABINDRAFT_163747 [Babjeviella inositovora NRRL Y-12698]